MQRRWNVFPFLMITLMIMLYVSHVQKSHQTTRTKFINYLQGFHNSYSRKFLKIWPQWFQERQSSWGFTLTNLDAVNQKLFQKNFTRAFFPWSTRRYQVKILSRYYRRGLKGQELQWNCKTNQGEPLQKIYFRHFHNILSKFCLNVVSMDRCQILWLVRSRKVVGCKVEMPFPNPWVLKEGEVLTNEGCRDK